MTDLATLQKIAYSYTKGYGYSYPNDLKINVNNNSLEFTTNPSCSGIGMKVNIKDFEQLSLNEVFEVAKNIQLKESAFRNKRSNRVKELEENELVREYRNLTQTWYGQHPWFLSHTLPLSLKEEIKDINV